MKVAQCRWTLLLYKEKNSCRVLHQQAGRQLAVTRFHHGSTANHTTYKPTDRSHASKYKLLNHWLMATNTIHGPQLIHKSYSGITLYIVQITNIRFNVPFAAASISPNNVS